MRRAPAGLHLLLFWASSTVLLTNSCQDSSQSPASRPETPQKPPPETGVLGPIDLVYVCGNKFLATNATGGPVQVEYRVVGTEETRTVNLVQGPEEDPAYGETEVE